MWLFEHWMELLLGIQALMAAGLAIALVIPGEQPDKSLEAIVNFLKKISKK